MTSKKYLHISEDIHKSGRFTYLAFDHWHNVIFPVESSEYKRALHAPCREASCIHSRFCLRRRLRFILDDGASYCPDIPGAVREMKEVVYVAYHLNPVSKITSIVAAET